MTIRLFEVVLLLNLTGLFSFVGIQVGLSIAVSTAVMLAFLGYYAFANYRSVIWYMKIREIFLWASFIFFWPLLTLLYSEFKDFRAVGVNLYLILLMLGSAIWAARVGVERVRRIFMLAGIIAGAGLILSLLKADYFQSVAEAANAKSWYLGRAFGFYLQPNMAAVNLSFIFALLLPILASSKPRHFGPTTAVFAALVFVTGSRGGILIAITLLLYAYFITHGTRQARISGQKGKLIAVLLTVVSLWSAWQILQILGTENSQNDKPAYTVIDRLQAVGAMDWGGGGLSETAIARIIAFSEHTRGITDSPLIGFGLASSQNSVESGLLTFPSHNQFLELAYNFGIPFMVLFIYILAVLWGRCHQNLATLNAGLNPARMLAIAATLSAVFSNNMLNSRVFFSVLGVILAIKYVPLRVYRREIYIISGDSDSLRVVN